MLSGLRNQRAATRHDDIDLERYQFCRKGRQSFWLAQRNPEFDQDVSALDVAEVTRALTEGLEQADGPRAGVCRAGMYVADSRDLGRRLRLGREACRSECAGGGQEVPALGAEHALPYRKLARV
jgi:hypothetical protein